MPATMRRPDPVEADPVFVATGATDAELAASIALEVAARVAALLVLEGEVDADLTAAMVDVDAALALKQAAATAATDAELASAVADLTTAISAKQDAATAATDAEVTAAIAAHAAGDATDAELAAAVATLQPLDSDLTAIAALATTATGRSLLAAADAAAIRAITGAQDASTAATDAELAVESAARSAADALLLPKSLVDAKGDLIVATANDTPARKAVGANAEGLVADTAQGDGLAWAEVFDRRREITPYAQEHDAITGTFGLLTQAGQYFGGAAYNASAAQNDAISYDVALAKGTYAVSVVYYKSNNIGIITVTLDGVDLGTFNGYAAVLTLNQRVAFTGAAIAASGKKRLTLAVKSKDALSTNFYYIYSQIVIRRTA